MTAHREQLGRELCPITNALLSAGYRYAVIGATAILIHGYEIRRTTRDVDLVMVVEGGFSAMREMLVNIGLRPSSISHRFAARQGTQVDILPIAGTDTVQRAIQTPEGGSFSALGLSEAILSSAKHDLGTCQVAVAAVSVLVALKLNAAIERGRDDLPDSCVCLSEYAKNDIRRHIAHYENRSVLTYDTSGAYLAGADFAGNGGAEIVASTRQAVYRLLANEVALTRTARRLQIGEEVPAFLLQAFVGGMEASTS